MKEETKGQFADAASMTEDQFLEAMKQLNDDGHFHGFSCCGHNHGTEGEPGLLWNDAGHRIQIEMGIWVLTALDPGNPFLSLWSFPEFRTGFYTGLWEADYRSPYRNFCGAVGLGFAIYTSHFYDPDTRKHIGQVNQTLIDLQYNFPVVFEEFHENAFSMVLRMGKDASKHYETWKTRLLPCDLKESGRCLGIAVHYFTDLTQPMHAANFANGIGLASTHQGIIRQDARHSKFEKRADEILNKPDSPHRSKLLCDPGKAAVSFSNDASVIINENARAAKDIFIRKVAKVMEDLQGKWEEDVPMEKALEAFEEAFPKGQYATSRFLQQWARANDEGQPYSKLRSDWVAVSERPDSHTEELHPCMFYRQDGDLKPIFRYFDRGKWHEDSITFAAFAGSKPNTQTTFAACYDKSTKHPALFIPDADGQLYYFHAPNGWQPVKIKMPPGGKVRGAICAVYDDERYHKPCAFYRGELGQLYFVYWNGKEFVAHAPLRTVFVGGAISAVWDPHAALPDRKGHPAASFIGGDGLVHHVHVRDGKWIHQVISLPQSANGVHADPQMMASVFDAKENSVGIFWGSISYKLEIVPESNPTLFFRNQMPAELTYTLVKEGFPATPLHVAAAGGISATTKPHIMVHYRPFYSRTLHREGAEQINGTWVRQEFASEGIRTIGNIAAADAQAQAIIAGSRSIHRNKFGLSKHSTVIPFKHGQTIVLLADNNRYVARINRTEIDPVEAALSEPGSTSQFRVSLRGENRIALMADTGKYIGRVFRNGIHGIEAFHSEVNEFSTFRFTILQNGHVVFIADNGELLGREEARKNAIIAGKVKQNHNVFRVIIV